MINVHLLVTGFGPFASLSTNPAEVLAKLVAEGVEGGASVILPTSYARSIELLERSVADLKPQALLMLGFSARANPLKIETTGRAVSSVTVPDIDGQVWRDVANGVQSEDRMTSVRAESIASLVQHRGIEVTVSDDAGGYVCNAAYHHALAFEMPVLFVHVGPNEQMAAQSSIVDSLIDIAKSLLTEQ
jgi:pyroglutamyl-peptidase